MKAEVWRQTEAYGRLQLEYSEERAMRRMTEQQYISLKKKARSQVSDVPSAYLGSIARLPPSTKRGRREEGGSGAPP